jgi:capsular exopolysaccharide synthesis family protein
MHVDNMDDKIRYQNDSTGRKRQHDPGSRVTASEYSNRLRKVMRPAEIIPVAERPISSMDAASLPNSFAGVGEFMPSGMPWSDILRSILRFKWTVLALFILVAGPAIAAIWTQVVPKYQARGQIRVRPIIPYLVFPTENSRVMPLYSSFVKTQVAMIGGSKVLDRVVLNEDVRKTRWFAEPQESLVQRLRGNPPAPPVERLRSGLSVRALEGSEVVEVAFVNSGAKEAETIVNAVLDEYLGQVDDSDPDKNEIYLKLEEEYSERKRNIDSQEETIAGIKERLGPGDPEELISAKRVRLDEMEGHLNEFQRTIDVLNWEITQKQGSDSNGVAVSLLKPKHPDMDKMEKEREFVEDSLRRRQAQLDEQWRDRPKDTTVEASEDERNLAFLRDQLEMAKYEKQRELAAYEELKTNFKELSDTAQLLENENAKLAEERELFDKVRQRWDQKNMERSVPGRISIFARARASSSPQDHRIAYTAMVLVLTAGISSGVAYLRAAKSQTIHAVADMPRLMQVQLLGHIPVTRIRGSFGRSLQNEVQKSRAQRIESVRLVRTALLSRLRGHSGVAIQVTSAGAGTGKSTFTTMLGKSLAQAGKSVLIIDADLRRMTLTKRFGLFGELGFVESLRAKSEGEPYIFPTEEPGLSIMPAGRLTEGGAVFEETANGTFKSCISRLRKQYDVILLDSSPVLPVADATILSSQVDATIMVERELVSHRGGMIDALDRLDSAGGRLLGTVFVGSGGTKGYGYGSDYDHDYETTDGS